MGGASGFRQAARRDRLRARRTRHTAAGSRRCRSTATSSPRRSTRSRPGLAWAVKLDKGDFVGRKALERFKEASAESAGRARAGRQTDCPPGHGRVFRERREVGEVTSGTFSPTLQVSLAMAYVDPGLDEPGTKLTVDMRGHREPARVVKLPFYKRAREAAPADPTCAGLLFTLEPTPDLNSKRGSRFMDRKSLGYLASHEWVHMEGQHRDDRHHPVRRRTVDRSDHDRASRGGNQGHGRQVVRRDRKRQGGERPLCAGQRRGDRSQQRRHVQRAGPCRRPLSIKAGSSRCGSADPPQTAELLDLASYEKQGRRRSSLIATIPIAGTGTRHVHGLRSKYARRPAGDARGDRHAARWTIFSRTIPEELRTKGPLAIPPALSELELTRNCERGPLHRTRGPTRRSASWAAGATITSFRPWSTTSRPRRVLHRLHSLPGGGQPGNAAGDV